MNQMWDDALVYIQEKVPKQVYETWFTPVVLDRVEDTTAYLAVPNKFFGEWLGEHYHDLLAEAVSAAQGGGRMDVSFVINNKQAPPLCSRSLPLWRRVGAASWRLDQSAACSSIPSIRSRVSSLGPEINSPMRPVWRWLNNRPKPTTRCSSMGSGTRQNTLIECDRELSG